MSNKGDNKKCNKYMQFMNVEVHPSLLEVWYCSNIAEEVSSSGARVVTAKDLFDPALVIWSRKLTPELSKTDGQVQLKIKEECEHALYILYVDDLVSHVCARSLAGHVAQIRDMSSRTVTVVLYGTLDYFKGISRRKTLNSKANLMTQIDLEMALTDLLVSAQCDSVKVETPYELASLIVQMTKALAEAPCKKRKRDCDELAQFYMRGDNKKCVRIDDEGHGTGRLWQQMVAMLPMASLEISRALCARYKTPRELYQALESQNGENEVANIHVPRTAVPGSRDRRIGPEFARKLHTLLTAEDGDILLD